MTLVRRLTGRGGAASVTATVPSAGAQQESKRILVVGHSTLVGGAETALLNLIRLLNRIGHRVTALLPEGAGPFRDRAESLGCRCLTAPLPHMLPSPARTCQVLARTDFAALAAALGGEPVDAVISNTAVVFHGALLAAGLAVPHLWYVHELIDDSPELRPRGVTPAMYWRWLHQLSDHVFCCSEAVSAALRRHVREPANYSVLPPFLEPAQAGATGSRAGPDGAVNLYFIGYLSDRKNPEFAVEVLKALVFRGSDARLHFLGIGGLEDRVRKLAGRRGVADRVAFHGHLADPYSRPTGRGINLICATCEPFGLTIPESLLRGIPVVGTRSGGPDPLLDEDRLYPVGDLRRCVSIVEEIAAAYAQNQAKARDNYRRLRPLFAADAQQAIVETGLAQAAASYRRKEPPFFMERQFADALGLKALPKAAILRNIAAEAGVEDVRIGREIEEEAVSPGAATVRECREFDAVPFHPGPQMDTLYRAGRGVAIDLAATLDEPGQAAMGAFILLRLCCEREAIGRGLTALVLGDGIGRDSIRLAAAGFSVVYCDYGKSLTSRVAARNIGSFREAAPSAGAIRMADRGALGETFDAVIVLEVIEHMPDPVAFLHDVAQLTREGGLVFASECFEGVEDKWPTHLAANEKLAGALPLLAGCAGLALEDYALEPFGKPFLFRKTATTQLDQTAAVLRDRRLMRELADRQRRIL